MTLPIASATSGGAGPYEVGVAIMPLPPRGQAGPEPSDHVVGIPGYQDTIGKHSSRIDGIAMVQRGEDALYAAIDAIGGQIALIAQRIGSSIEVSAQSSQDAGSQAFGIESVQVSFGITLSAGLQTVFTAQAESSAQVTLTLSRQV